MIYQKEEGEGGTSEKEETNEAVSISEKYTKSSENKKASKASKNLKVKSQKKKSPATKEVIFFFISCY